MKVVYFDGFFELPDDFEGGLNEALEAIVSYRKCNKKKNKVPHHVNDEWKEFLITQDKVNLIEHQASLYSEKWSFFLKNIKKEKRRLVASISLASLNQDNTWTIEDLG